MPPHSDFSLNRIVLLSSSRPRSYQCYNSVENIEVCFQTYGLKLFPLCIAGRHISDFHCSVWLLFKNFSSVLSTNSSSLFSATQVWSTELLLLSYDDTRLIVESALPISHPYLVVILRNSFFKPVFYVICKFPALNFSHFTYFSHRCILEALLQHSWNFSHIGDLKFYITPVLKFLNSPKTELIAFHFSTWHEVLVAYHPRSLRSN